MAATATATLLLPPPPPTPHEDKLKRKMKTPLQLETLERVFAEEKYPSEAIRARLSIQLGLSNRQLKMWFCHRRLKERKSKDQDEGEDERAEEEEEKKDDHTPILASNQYRISPEHGEAMRSGNTTTIPHDMHRLSPTLPLAIKKEEQVSSGSYHSEDHENGWKIKRRHESINDSTRKRNKHLPTSNTVMNITNISSSNGVDPCRLAELQAIASVEAQLGEPLRWDSPCLGLDFDPLPHGAFTSTAAEQRKSFSSQDSRDQEENRGRDKSEFNLQKDSCYAEHAHNRKMSSSDTGNQSVSNRSGSRFLHEYQFIPERPTGRDGMMTPLPLAHSRVCIGPESGRQGMMVPQGSILQGESLGNAFGLDGKPLANLMIMQRDTYENHHAFGPQPQILHQDAYSSAFGYEGQFGVYNNLNILPNNVLSPQSFLHGIENIPIYNEQELLMHGNKRRKSEEIRLEKEMDAQRKRIQKEMEREDLARRKREEHLQKEREKEAERIMREKQREDERIQKELKREIEQQYRLLQKEAQKLEREREKEEARRLKESTRLKASIERATARRLARECVELIDDERLELLEAAAASQGLPSIYLLDGDTLQSLDRYKDSLKKFPPPSVKMKSPLAISPWIDSQQNLGNLLMMWKFLIAFADVLGLWPFTLDEFVQAFHDYDPRLLAEIHISLIRTIIRDIEDVAKASASGGAVNQYTAPSSIGGGHSQLVEAAYAWGFDYKQWDRHLNLLTWPEILRQFSLAAGYGPIWKQQETEAINACTVDEGHHIHQKGHAAEQNVKSVNRGRGGSHSRKYGYKLTPGTVKYAAFHVVSAQGPNGLSITEIADRIEKYGLRDLSTSKTPESSIAAALSRDTIFFERVAPSTYCVKPQFQKNPEDADRLIQEAVERTRLFQSGNISDTCNVEKGVEDIDEVEREQVSDDESDSMDIDDKHQANASYSLKERKVIECKSKTGHNTKESLVDNSLGSSGMHDDGSGKHALVSSVISMNEFMDGRETSLHLEKIADSALDTELDESHMGEPWVQGLMEGEYSDLSVEERLNALVALVEAVNEGNTIRVALEGRMEAATALKRQMWAEAQQDKRRSKEEQLSKAQSQPDELVKSEGSMERDMKTSLMDGSQVVSKNSNLDKESQQENSSLSLSGAASEKTRAQLKADIDFRADELYVFRSQPLGLDRRHNRYWQFVTSYVADDPGCGRLYFESSEDGHWEVIDTEEALGALMENLDTRGVREAHLHGVLQKLEKLIRQGMRKLSAHDQRLVLNESEAPSTNNTVSANTEYPSENGSSGSDTLFHESGNLKSRGAIQIHIQAERYCMLEKYKEFEKWLWSRQTPELSDLISVRMSKKKSCELLIICETCHDLYWPWEKQCSRCDTMLGASAKLDTKFSHCINECVKEGADTVPGGRIRSPVKLLPSRLKLLKVQVLSIEAALPREAMNSSWTESHRKAWGASLKHASSAGELLQILTELERAVKRDWLSSPYETTEELLEFSARVDADDATVGSTLLPWVPRTTSAVALRLMVFDSALFYNADLRKQNTVPNSSNKPEPRLISSNEVANVDTKKLLSVEEGISISQKDRAKLSDGALSHQPLLVKLSRGRCVSSASDKNNVSNSHTRGRSKHSFPHHEDQRDEKTRPEENDNKEHCNKDNGQIHYETEKCTSEDGNEEEELIVDEYEEEEDEPSEEFYQAKEQALATEEPDTDSMEEDINDEDEDEDEDEDDVRDAEQKHWQMHVGCEQDMDEHKQEDIGCEVDENNEDRYASDNSDTDESD